jgi:hypothetical protein
MAAIPLVADRDQHDPSKQWTILVTPGYYPEVIRFKPYVNVGLLKEAVIIAGTLDDLWPVRAQVYLCTRSLLGNVTLHIWKDSKQGDFVVRGYDGNEYHDRHEDPRNVRFLGLSNVDFQNASGGPLKGGGLIKFDGDDWRTVIFRDVGGNYEAPEGYGIKLKGNFQNADCHFINCFFDALFLLKGGFIHITDCFEVHLRNSLVRVDYKKVKRILKKKRRPPLSAVKTTRSPGGEEPDWKTSVLIEGSALYGLGGSVLDVGKNTVCFFRHSSSDSRSGTGKFIASGPDGIGNSR